jgi:hypothetical protein
MTPLPLTPKHKAPANMENKKLIDQLEMDTFQQDDSSEHPPGDIVAYNELRSCADLFRMHLKKVLKIAPSFQREVVWKGPAQTRFIDSLIKQLPIPSMCFSLDYKTQEWQVIDGLQRISSIIRFLSPNSDWVLSNLEDVDPSIAGSAVSDFKKTPRLRSYLARVENLTLPITVLRCDYSKRSHQNYLFTIFHRLNTGGLRLNNQEIRNCIYSGTFNTLLNSLNKNRSWKKINRMKKVSGYRFAKQELILRFFAFHDRHSAYAGKLAEFLNYYLSDNRNPPESFLAEKRDLFQRTVRLIFEKIFDKKSPGKLSLTVLEAVLIGVASNIESLTAAEATTVRKMYNALLKRNEFSEQTLSEGLSKTGNVLARIKAAKRCFAG